MRKRRILTLAITGTAVATVAALVTLGTTGASTTTTTSAHLTAKAAVAPSGCVTEIFTEYDEPDSLSCVQDAQILLNDLWYYQTDHPGVYLGTDQLLTVDGAYGPDTASDVGSFQAQWKLSLDHELGPKTWADLCYVDALHGYDGVYYRAAGCPSVFGL